MIPYNYNIEIKLLEACVLFLILLLLTERGILPLVSVTIRVMLLYPEIQQKKKQSCIRIIPLQLENRKNSIKLMSSVILDSGLLQQMPFFFPSKKQRESIPRQVDKSPGPPRRGEGSGIFKEEERTNIFFFFIPPLHSLVLDT